LKTTYEVNTGSRKDILLMMRLMEMLMDEMIAGGANYTVKSRYVLLGSGDQEIRT
jgi:hypothetical protein